MTQRIFLSPQDCEAAFYEALEKADLDAMMAVWADDEEIVCVHPGGPRLVGLEAVREAWRRVFQGGARLSVRIGNVLAMQSMMMATHCVHEFIGIKGEARPAAPVVATNVYVRSGNGWKLLLHHSSTSPKVEQGADKGSAGARPKVLH
ncbi:MAG: nuclear transport factor 2 family protein [Burkholderiales bacterium]|nr:nuclear transport factor 2 family protein [Burkholderiales bacterium]